MQENYSRTKVQPRSETHTVELREAEMSRSLEELDLCPLPAGPSLHHRQEEEGVDSQQVHIYGGSLYRSLSS